jgi:general secretion pathway protein M
MNQTASLRKLVAMPVPGAALYVVITGLLLFLIGSALTDILSQRADVAASAAMLEQLEGRRPAAVHAEDSGIMTPSGSPFLEGATVTIAGAALLQRVSSAVTTLGGSVLSSQVDLQGTQSRPGFLSIIASCEIDQSGVQKLLYDLEAGMPFLFIDQLVLQSPMLGGSGESKLRVLLSVSGRWQGTK